jgi:2-keto-4-pentenoate hydratase
MNSHAELARGLRDAHRMRQDFVPIRIDGRVLDTRTAYAVQDELVAQLLEERKTEVVGYKIGLTSKAMQTMCGIPSPIHGRILRTGVHHSGARIDPATYGRLGIEFEIAVRIGRDITAPDASVADMALCVDAICPALELVDDRNADYATLDGPSLVADNSWNAGVVLGEWQALPEDVQMRRGHVFLDGAQIDTALVGDALDHPLTSVGWLAAALAQEGKVLRAGMIVMTGSIVKTRFPKPGEHWRYAVEGLSEVTVDFG